MAKFSGNIGYVESVRDPAKPSVWKNTVTEKHHTGDILKNFKLWEGTTNLNDNINVRNKVSIVASSTTLANSHKMKYIIMHGVRWDIKSIDIEYPRLILSIGGVYNGPTPPVT